MYIKKLLIPKSFIYATLLYFLSFFLSSTALHAAGILTGPSSVCAGTTTTYFYDDQNSYCSALEWKVYENGVLKTTGISGSSNYMNVTWSNGATSGKVEARGMNGWFIYPDEWIDCGYWQQWKSMNISVLPGTPNTPSGTVVFCINATQNWTVTPHVQLLIILGKHLLVGL